MIYNFTKFKGGIILENINVQFLDMDTKIPEHLIKNADDSYTIFLNSKLSREEHLKSYLHALSHIQNGDFDKLNVNQIEYDAHGL